MAERVAFFPHAVMFHVKRANRSHSSGSDLARSHLSEADLPGPGAKSGRSTGKAVDRFT